MLFITQNTEEKAAEALRIQPLANARIVARATSIKEFYGITAMPAFVIADQNRTIKYNGVGVGPSGALKVKNVLNEMRGLVPDGYYSLTYDQKHLMLAVKGIKLMKESKFHEAAQVYESLFIHSMGRGLQQDYYYAASAWANLGDAEKAFHYLKQAAVVTKYSNLLTLNSEPNFTKLKADMRWKAITDRVSINSKEKLASGAKLNESAKVKSPIRVLAPNQFTPFSLIKELTIKGDMRPINVTTMADAFPEDWVKASDIDSLISLIGSTTKANCFLNPLSSNVSRNESADVGGYAMIFINSFRQKQKVSLGLYNCPKTNKEAVDEILKWWNEFKGTR